MKRKGLKTVLVGGHSGTALGLDPLLPAWAFGTGQEGIRGPACKANTRDNGPANEQASTRI
jgi:hypothetical protein